MAKRLEAQRAREMVRADSPKLVTRLFKLLDDERTPATAQVQAAIALARIGALLGPADDDDAEGKPLASMSRDELVEAADKARAYLADLDAAGGTGAPDPGVFD